MFEWIQQYWLTVVFGGIIGLLTLMIKKAYSTLIEKYKSLTSDIEKEKTEQSSIKDGVLALLHDRLYQACQYHMLKGYITVDELSNLKYLYESYNVLGGNGTGTELYTRCKGLRIVTDKEIKEIMYASMENEEGK